MLCYFYTKAKREDEAPFATHGSMIVQCMHATMQEPSGIAMEKSDETESITSLDEAARSLPGTRRSRSLK